MALVRPIVAALIAVALAAGVASAAPKADVTLAMRQYTNENKIRVFVWHGRVATAAAGEDVEVLGRACLTKDYRLYAGTRTAAGGGWEVESASTPGSLQHRRRELRNDVPGALARPVEQHDPPQDADPQLLRHEDPQAASVEGDRQPDAALHEAGRQARRAPAFSRGQVGALQERAKLVLKANYDYGGATNYEAVFETPTRGMRVRAILPAKTVAPCYLGKATEPWRT